MKVFYVTEFKINWRKERLEGGPPVKGLSIYD